uniref:BHLH domain-containing protein n=1 Tax=Steinernema glaseri TaxID=37863 RepID=A0A1I8A3H9_9BILA
MAHNATIGAVSFAGEQCRSSSGGNGHLRPMLRSASVDVAAAAAARRAPSSITSTTNHDGVFAVPTHPAPRSRPSIIRRTAAQKHKKPQAGVMMMPPPPSSLSKQAYMDKMGNEKAVELEEIHRRNQMLERLLAALRASEGSSMMRHKLVEVPGCSLDMRTGRLRVLDDLVELADSRQHQTSAADPPLSQNTSTARPPPVPVIEGK